MSLTLAIVDAAREALERRGLSAAWVGAKGALTYVNAVVTGDMADAATVNERRAACISCPSRERHQVDGADEASDWCGPALEDHTGKMDNPTCGCLLAGKTAVASERCPQGRWRTESVESS